MKFSTQFLICLLAFTLTSGLRIYQSEQFDPDDEDTDSDDTTGEEDTDDDDDDSERRGDVPSEADDEDTDSNDTTGEEDTDDDADDSERRGAVPSDAEPLASMGTPLRHGGGLCVGREGKTSTVSLQQECQDFYMTKKGAIVHKDSKRCLHSPKRKNNGFIVLSDDCESTKSTWEVTKGDTLKNAFSKKCIHPHNGRLDSAPGTKIVVFSGCNDEARLHFKFDKILATITHSGGLCATYDEKKKKIVLMECCEEKFEISISGRIIHTPTKKCLIPLGEANNARIGLTSDCKSPKTVFMKTPSNSIVHSSTGKCWHPYWGSPKPKIGTEVVIYNGCNQKRLAFSIDSY